MYFSSERDTDFIKGCFINSHPILLDRVPHTLTRVSHEHWNLYNPSILRYEDGFLVTARSSNCSLAKETSAPDFYFYNQLWNINHLFYFDKKNTKIWHKELVDSSIKEKFKSGYHGIEDIRLFEFEDKVHCVATCVTVKEGLGHAGYKARPVSFNLIDNVATNPLIWESSLGRKAEKNWTPLVKNDALYLVHQLDPLTIVEINGDKASLRKGQIQDHPITISGGTPFVKIGSNYLAVAHYPKLSLDKHYYRHCFVVMSSHFELVEISEPFFIQRRGIEFACGLTRDDDDLLLSYGVADRAAFYARIPIDSLKRYVFSL